MQIVELKDSQMASVSASGATRDIALDLTPQAKVGDYVLVHAGFSIEIVDPDYAKETLDLIQEMADMADDPLFNPGLAEEVCTVDHGATSSPIVGA